MLDLVQHHLELNGFTFQRIDGQSSLSKRNEAMRLFTEDPKCTVMLASIGSAGEGCVQYLFLLLRRAIHNFLRVRLAQLTGPAHPELQNRSHSGESCPFARASLESNGRSPGRGQSA